jgi:membrane associated rhomboid family serine protease
VKSSRGPAPSRSGSARGGGDGSTGMGGAFERPTGFLAWLLGGMATIWLVFAILLNWVKVGGNVYAALLMNVDGVLRGEVWRFFTAPFIHSVTGQGGVTHILFNSLLLYSSARHLQPEWGGKRLAFVLFSAALAAEVLQLAAFWVLPPLGQPIFYGSYAMTFAAISAFGFSHRDLIVSVFFWQMRAVNLVWLSLAFYLLVAIAAGRITEGLLAPFVGAGVGYLLGGSTPSPLKRFFLRRKLAEIERETEKKRSHLRVVGTDDFGLPPKKSGDDPQKKEWLN